jgi:hypothetical protein
MSQIIFFISQFNEFFKFFVIKIDKKSIKNAYIIVMNPLVGLVPTRTSAEHWPVARQTGPATERFEHRLGVLVSAHNEVVGPQVGAHTRAVLLFLRIFIIIKSKKNK